MTRTLLVLLAIPISSLTSYSAGFVTAIARDEKGNIYLSGTATIKYDGSGTIQWVRQDSLFGGDNDVAIDKWGNVIVTGTNSSYDWVTIKYDPEGGTQWMGIIPDAEGQRVAVDDSGAVHVSGRATSFVGDYDFVTAKYDSGGSQQWIRYYDPYDVDDLPYDFTVDAAGRSLVTGLVTGFDSKTVNYDALGTEMWAVDFDGCCSHALAVYGSSVLVTGYRVYGLFDGEIVTVRYDSSGQVLWSSSYNWDESVDSPRDIVTDRNGNVYVVAISDDPVSGYDAVTIKYDSTGEEQWASRFDNSDEDDLYRVVVDSIGNSYVFGYTTIIGQDFLVVKYDPSGNELWAVTYDAGISGRTQFDDYPIDMVIDDSSNVYVTGNSDGLSTVEIATIKYSSSGELQWVRRYDHTLVSVPQGGAEVPLQYSLTQNYPNPFNPSTTIRYSLPRSGEVSLKIFNLLGEEVTTLVSGNRNAGPHTVQWDATGQPSGVYFYRLQAGEFVQTRKLVLVR